MAGDAEATWMGQAMSVAKDQIGKCPEFLERGENRGRFAKRKQTGHIRETGFYAGFGAGEWFEPWNRHQDDGGVRQT